MLVTCWILFIIFGLVALNDLIAYLAGKITRPQMVTFVISVFTAALSAGYIWGR